MSIIIAMPQMGNDLFRKYMKSKYVKSLERAGAKVKWIECEDIENHLAELLSCNGLLLPGGADVNPALYGEEKAEKCGKPNDLRDKAEMIILKEFLKTEKPILGICRGCQLINTYFGGKLFQDIKDTQKEKHMDFFSRAKSTHEITLSKKTKLREIFKSNNLRVNSMHHQAIKTVGEGLISSAESSDGFVEAIESTSHPYLLAVQWHPEHMSKKSETQRRLFTDFVNHCK